MACCRYIAKAISSHPVASAVAFIVCVVRHVEIMLDLHPMPTLSRASPVESASLHDLVELHWHTICMSQAAQSSGLVSGITIVPSSCLRVGAHEIEVSARRRQ